MQVVFFGTYDERVHPRVRALRQGFEAHGHDVVSMNAPLGFDTAARVRLARQPWRLPLFLAGLLGCWARLVIEDLRRRRLRLPSPDVVVVGYLGAFDVHLARVLFRRSVIVLDHLVGLGDTVRDRGAGSDGLASLLDRLDRAARARADAVVFDTDEQRAATVASAGLAAPPDPWVVVPVGAADEWFADPPGDPTGDGALRVLYVGVYTPLHGMPVAADAIARLDTPRTPDTGSVTFLFAGDGQERPQVEAILGDDPRVRFLDWVDADDLPALHRKHDVALGVFATDDKTARVVPTKVFQAHAAGCVVVTADVPPVRRAITGGVVLVPPGDADALAEVLDRLRRDTTWRRDLADRARATRDAHRPARIVEPLLDALAHLTGSTPEESP